MIGIYKITNKCNGKCYIGQAIDIKSRWRKHRCAYHNPNSHAYNYPLYKAIRKYGLKNFSFEVLEECSKAELNEREMFYIAKYQANTRQGYNQNDGGNVNSYNFKLSTVEVLQIINRLRTTLDNTKTIAKDFGVGYTTIRGINVGEIYRQENIQYPIRQDMRYWNRLDRAHIVITTEGITIDKEAARNICKECGRPIAIDSIHCPTCAARQRRKADRPPPLQLAKLVKENGFSKTGRMFGVNCNAIKKWCDDYDIPRLLPELIDWYNNQINP